MNDKATQKALDKAARLTMKASIARIKAAEAQASRDESLLEAFSAGASYKDLARVSGLTEFRITQVLRTQRNLST